MEPSHLEPLALLDCYLAGECTPAESAIVQAYLSREQTAEVALKQAGRLTDDETYVPDRTAGWTALAAELGLDSMPKTTHRRHIVATPRRTSWWATASVLAVLAVIAGWGWSRTRSTGTEQTYATGASEIVNVRLSDGTRIALAPQTRLTVSRDFGKASRTVQLVGEAYFDITATAGAPFIVRSGRVSTRVLGTQFSVRYEHPADPVEVTVLSGKVATAMHDRATTVSAGHIARVTDSTTTLIGVDEATTYTDWSRGRIAFRDAPVPVVLATLQRWYGYDFQFADTTLATEAVTAVFSMHEQAETMQLLGRVLGVSMTFDSLRVTLHRKNPTKVAPAFRERRHYQFHPTTEVGR